MNLPKTPGRTTPAFGFSYIERSLKDCLRKRQFRAAERREVSDFFERWEPQPSCVYCGNKDDVRRWDHIVPVIKGGATVLGNMVLACTTCDDSKVQRGFDEWMFSDAPDSPRTRLVPNLSQRRARIMAYIERFGYEPEPEEDILNRVERERLQAIRGRLASLRQEVDSLVSDFRRRTGFR